MGLTPAAEPAPEAGPARGASATPTAAVFDLDGTLVRTEARQRVVWRSFLDGLGVEHNNDLLHSLTGRRGRDSLADLRHLFPGRELDDLHGQLVEADAAEPLGPVEPVPGALELVRRLEPRTRLGLVTSAGRTYADEVLEGIGCASLFAVVVTAENVRSGKPDPEGYLAACRALDVAPQDATGFEDSQAGVAAVKAAGMFCVAVATTFAAEALAAADLVVPDFTELPAAWTPTSAAHRSTAAWPRASRHD